MEQAVPLRRPADVVAQLYANAFKPLMAQTFNVLLGVPETMRALLAQLDQTKPVGRSLGDRLDAIRTLTEAETYDVQAAATPKN